MKKQNGFTLVEAIVLIVIIGIVAAGSSRLLSAGLTSYLAAKNVNDADWQARLALERMIRDLREIRSPGDITTATSSQITFTNTSNASVNYQLSGSTILLNGQILTDGVNSMSLSYQDENGNTTATPNLIRFIIITLQITRNNTNFTVATSVFPRNLT